MKILLLGEYSSFHLNLKEGLKELGCDVLLVGTGDGFKKIPMDISLDSTLPGRLGGIERAINYFKNLKNFTNYDVVQVINPFLFHHLLPIPYFFRQLKSKNKALFLLGAGDDAFFWRLGRYQLRYGPFDDFLKYDLKKKKYFMESSRSFKINKKVLEYCNGIIPIMYEYEVSYQGQDKLLNTIPIPVNTSKVTYRENMPAKKIVVFHGLNRYGFKGTRHVEQAFNYLNQKYPNDLELIIDGNMPLEKYLGVLRRSNVVIDQLNSYSLGVNGVYALAMGKIVMGGAEQESLKSLGLESSPVINLTPDPESIIHEVCMLLERRDQIEAMGYESRLFAERVHGHIVVAKKFIDTWVINS